MTDGSQGQPVLSDLDGDGAPDLVVTEYDNDVVIVLMGNGDGTLQPALSFYTGDGPLQVAVGDVDNDDKQDLVVTIEESRSFSVLPGNGDGTFQAAIEYVYWTGGVLDAVRLADLNGDGTLDLVLSRVFYESSLDRIIVALGNGDGTFALVGQYYVRQPGISIEDQDGDGFLDMFVSSYGDYYVYPGNGDGSFGAAVELDNGYPSGPWVLGDLDGDGHVDWASISKLGNNVSVIRGNGDGTYEAPSVAYGVGRYPMGLAIGDLDGNGSLDLVTADYDDDTVSVLLNARGTVFADLTCTPSAGTLPFQSLFQATMTNHYQGQVRRFQYTIDVTVASGQYYSSWRRGWQNIQAGETYTKQWNQNIPDLPSVLGVNFFEMTVADVTPPPYNLPPYAPAGDTDWDNCTVTGVAP